MLFRESGRRLHHRRAQIQICQYLMCSYCCGQPTTLDHVCVVASSGERDGRVWLRLQHSAVGMEGRYWCKKDAITPEDYDSINWVAAKKSLKEAPRGMQRFHGKFASRHIGVGRMMILRKDWGHSKCPLCGHDEETTQHVIKCPDARATKVWNSSMDNLNIYWAERTGH